MKNTFILLSVFACILLFPHVSNAQQFSVEAREAIKERYNLVISNIEKNYNKEISLYEDLYDKPTFKGGSKKRFSKWVENKLYNTKIMSPGSSGVIGFVVEKSGKIGDVAIIYSDDPNMSEVLEKIVKKSPKWNPGRENGKAVNTFIVYPIQLYGE